MVDGRLGWLASFDRAKVYLDLDSLTDLAKPANRTLRARFAEAIRLGGTLCFSEIGALELGARSGDGADAIRDLLNEVENYWLLLVMNPWEAINREESGLGLGAGVSEDFIQRFFDQRLTDLSGETIVNMASDSFFSLGAVVQWSNQDPKHVRALKEALKATLYKETQRLHAEYYAKGLNPPAFHFDPTRPVSFVTTHLSRLLTKEAKSHTLTTNDGADFLHATVGYAYADAIALDKQWKRRVQSLPPTGGSGSKCFYRKELPALVGRLEALVAARKA